MPDICSLLLVMTPSVTKKNPVIILEGRLSCILCLFIRPSWDVCHGWSVPCGSARYHKANPPPGGRMGLRQAVACKDFVSREINAPGVSHIKQPSERMYGIWQSQRTSGNSCFLDAPELKRIVR